MQIIRITEDEFRGLSPLMGPHLCAEAQAVLSLEPGTGLKVPCRWRHRGGGRNCGGLSVLGGAAHRHGFRVECRCTDGWLYVFRPQD